jgi:hypothetical protein
MSPGSAFGRQLDSHRLAWEPDSGLVLSHFGQDPRRPMIQEHRSKAAQEQIARCKREAEACARAGADPHLTHAERLGATQGEVDWLVALKSAEEDQEKIS